MADMSDKMMSSEQARQDDRAAATAERAALRQQNELLRRDVATLNEQVKTLTWKTFRPTGQLSSLLIGSSLIKQVSSDNLKDTDVVCLPGGRIKDVRDHLEALPSGYESITLLVGGNDCDVTPPPSAAAIVATYGGLLDMAIIKARNVTVSSICPRMTTTETQQTIDAVNAGLSRVSSGAKEGTYATTADMVEKLSVTHVIVSGIRPSFALSRCMATRTLPTE